MTGLNIDRRCSRTLTLPSPASGRGFQKEGFLAVRCALVFAPDGPQQRTISLMHDLLISDAVIVDGLGGTPYRADLAVAAGRIAAIGADLGAARRIVDADGLMLAPGIIDGHTHYDAQITWDPYADPSPALGVTTIVIGNCGFTIAPCKKRDRDLTMRNLTHV